jgi:hypothetical protein
MGDGCADGGTNILVLEMLQQLQFSVCPLCQDRSAERLHDLLDGNILVGELIPCGTVSRESTLLVPKIASSSARTTL